MCDKHCDMCVYYSQDEEDYENENGLVFPGYCSRWRERHYPSDAGCKEWEYWDDPEARRKVRGE